MEDCDITNFMVWLLVLPAKEGEDREDEGRGEGEHEVGVAIEHAE